MLLRLLFCHQVRRQAFFDLSKNTWSEEKQPYQFISLEFNTEHCFRVKKSELYFVKMCYKYINFSGNFSLEIN
jgi:hypothetical protein